LQQEEEEGRPWKSLGGMCCKVWKSFLTGKKKRKEKSSFPEELGSQPHLLASPPFTALPALISLSPRDLISFR